MQTLTARNEREGPFGFLARWWDGRKRRRAAARELDGCGDVEVAHLAHDIGVSTAELRTLAGKWPESANLLPRRMAAVGLDGEQILHTEPAVMRDLERICSQCADQSRCGHDLDRGDKNRAWRDYCPNVVTLDALRSQDRDQRLLRRRRNWRSF